MRHKFLFFLAFLEGLVVLDVLDVLVILVFLGVLELLVSSLLRATLVVASIKGSVPPSL